MKFTVSRETFLKPLMQVSGVVEKKQTKPILSNLLLQIKGAALSITATDMEIELIAKMPLEQRFEDAEITVTAKKLVDICRALPEDAILEFSLDDSKLVLKSGRSRYSLSTLPTNEFPNIEEMHPVAQFKMKQSKLRKLIDATSFAISQQDVRFYLKGMLFDLSEGEVRSVAADGHRLALAKLRDLDVTQKAQFIVPRKGIMEISRLFSEEDADVEVCFSANHIRVATEQLVFSSKLIDAEFPDYDRVIPKNGDKIMIGSREALKQAFTRAAILSNEKFRGVRVELAQGSLKISANNPEQEEAEEQIEVDYHDTPLEIGFNVNYILDVLNAIRGDTVRFILHDTDSSGLIEDANDPSARYVIMPLRM
jgi:DNA polymerase III subunit beta